MHRHKLIVIWSIDAGVPRYVCTASGRLRKDRKQALQDLKSTLQKEYDDLDKWRENKIMYFPGCVDLEKRKS